MMNGRRPSPDGSQYLDTGSLVVIVITFGLFVFALFVKGFTHDLLLEAGVLLVSIKLIIMSQKQGESNKKLLLRLDELQSVLNRLERVEPVYPSTLEEGQIR